MGITTRMTMDSLLCGTRERTSTSEVKEFRNHFDMDYERVITSSSLRRLQDKAQVFPLQRNDVARTRLTHSLEVSAFCRSMGRRIGFNLFNEGHITNNEHATQLASLLAVAGLVHDIGNPPFGHFGEEIIRNWTLNKAVDLLEISKICDISELDKESLYKLVLEKAENNKKFGWIKDYIFFDGNAQAIRILSRLQMMNDLHGMNFSFGTLATLLKRPWGSDNIEMALKEKKIGYFTSERILVKEILNKVHTNNKNDSNFINPLTLLLEAADDIAYIFGDIEDSVKKSAINWPEFKRYFKKIKFKTHKFDSIKKLMSKNISNITNGISSEKIQNEAMNFRVKSQGILIEEVCNVFCQNYIKIMNGDDQRSLLKYDELYEFYKPMKDYCREYIYSNEEIIQLELLGETVLKSLLDKFYCIVDSKADIKSSKTVPGKLYHLISSNFILVQDKLKKQKNLCPTMSLEQQRFSLMIDFISGMTDSYALKLHRVLEGIELP